MNDVNEDNFDCRFLREREREAALSGELSTKTLAREADITHEGPAPPATNEKT
jgi:hypothetical protein